MSGGSYRIQFLNPLYNAELSASDAKYKQLWASEDIKDNSTADELKAKLESYF